MNEPEFGKVRYTLVARMRGDELALEWIARCMVRRWHFREIDAIRPEGQSCGEWMLEQSIGWERLADFLAGCGRISEALHAYREALACCADTDGSLNCRDGSDANGDEDCGNSAQTRLYFRDWRLEMRFPELLAKVAAYCKQDSRLLQWLLRDPVVGEECARQIRPEGGWKP